MTSVEEWNSVVTDGELERGEHPIGKVVHISSVTHAWRGVLLAVTPSYYVFDPKFPVALVDSTGGIAEYLGSMTAVREGDEYKPKKGTKAPIVRINRNAASWIIEAA